jgi:hypothetical protein
MAGRVQGHCRVLETDLAGDIASGAFEASAQSMAECVQGHCTFLESDLAEDVVSGASAQLMAGHVQGQRRVLEAAAGAGCVEAQSPYYVGDLWLNGDTLVAGTWCLRSL